MAGEKRNTQVVACLLAAMTLGAALLLWLEPPVKGWSDATLLMAETVPAIREVRIEYVQPLTSENLPLYDCLVYPNGACDWRPHGGDLRLAVVGLPGEKMSEGQSRTLLAVFGSMTQRHGLDVKRIWLDPPSDARLHSELPSGAHDLVELLVRKGIIPQNTLFANRVSVAGNGPRRPIRLKCPQGASRRRAGTISQRRDGTMPRTFVQLPGFEIVSRIGKGAGAIIYEARASATRRRVAVKHILRNSPAEDRYIEQAEIEYKVAHELDHPYLRKCHDIIRVKRWLKIRELFLIMELVEGERLDDQFQDKRPENVEPVIDIFMHVAEGLRAMHGHGYVHADIKPNNILLPPNGGLKIIDFGQSCPIGHTKSRIQGTPDYIAPEQVLLAPLDQRTDIYNLGATMYWVLTGKAFSTILPNAPAGAKKIAIEARRGNDPPHEVNPTVPVPLSRLIMECCSNDREQRPADMSKLLSRFETILMLLDRRKSQPSPTESSG